MVNRRFAKVLAWRYKILAFIFVVLAGGLVLLPKYEKHEGISPEKLLSNALSTERYISTDELADRIINQDPSFILVDVRDLASYKKHSLKNSIHIPLDSILSESAKDYLDQDQYDLIFYSNNQFTADQAWMICKRLGYNNLFVLEGGVQSWFNTIINPVKPSENMTAQEFDIYSFRKAASMYFGVVYPEDIIQPKRIVKKAPPKKVVPVKKKKKMPMEGGC